MYVYQINWLFLFTVIAFVASIIGSAIEGVYYTFLKSLKACASYANEITTSCNVSSNYNCYGDEDYYNEALICAVGDTNTNDCICVNQDFSSADDDTCYTISNIGNCDNLLDSLPNQLQASYAACILCIITCIALLCLISSAKYHPTYFVSQEEIDRNNLIDGIYSIETPVQTQAYVVGTNNNNQSITVLRPAEVQDGTVATAGTYKPPDNTR